MENAMASIVASEHGILPLPPIEAPSGLFMRAVYALTKRRYGVTPTAFRVVYARFPFVALVSAMIVAVLDYGLRIPKDLRFLLQIGTSMRHGCTFCADLIKAEAVRAKVGVDRFRELLDFEISSAFTDREKAALAYAAAVSESDRVEDAVFSRLERYFDGREIVEIVWICAVESYFNKMALPLRIGSDHIVTC